VLAEIARVARPGAALLLRDLRRPSRPAFPWHVRWYGRQYSGAMYRLYRDSVRIVAGRFEATHPRLTEALAISTLSEHRTQLVAAVSGKRGKRYLERQHLLELGPAAHAYLTELTHRRPRIWVRDVERLHALLQAHGAEATRAAFEQALHAELFGAEYIAHYLAATQPVPPSAALELLA
jgi:hypothetical protein